MFGDLPFLIADRKIQSMYKYCVPQTGIQLRRRIICTLTNRKYFHVKQLLGNTIRFNYIVLSDSFLSGFQE
jgi:hypothetical protein